MSDGTGRIYKRGKVWWIDYGHRGRRHRESSGSHRKKDARALLKQRMGEIGAGTFAPGARNVRMPDLRELVVNDYKLRGRKSTRRLASVFAPGLRYFEGVHAADVTPGLLKAYVVWRIEHGGVSLATAKRELAGWRRGFTLAMEDGLLNACPKFPTFEINNARQGFVTAAQVDAICSELSPDLRPVARFAYLTGWRLSEYLNLRWANVDFEAGMVRLEPGTTKNDDGRTFPFAVLPPLAELLHEQRRRTDRLERERGMVCPWVFHRNGERIRSIRTAWEGACRRAGLSGVLRHDLRRSAVMNLERAGVPRSIATKLTGHRTEDVYARYAIAPEAALEEQVAKLAKLHAGQTSERDVVPFRAGSGTKTAQSNG